MHMADALIVPAVAATMYAATSAVGAYSVKKVRIENDAKKIPIMGVMAAFVFATQMINFTIPGTGSSGHFGGALLLAILLGPYAGFLAMISVLAVQCLLFADGGLLALGCNIWNMAFYACFVGYLLIYQPMVRQKMSQARIVVACILGSIVSLQLGAFSVVLETVISGVSDLSFGQFFIAMQPIHLVIGLVEGVITSAVVLFIRNARPALLHIESEENKVSMVQWLSIFAILTVFIGGGLSLVASQNPDGLEWSIQKATSAQEQTGNSEMMTATVNKTDLQAPATDIQGKTAILPDYGFANSDKSIGTSVSGIFGAFIVAIVSIGCFCVFKIFKKKDELQETQEY